MEDNTRSFKRPHNPTLQNSGNKRGKFSDQISETPHSSSETLYRILCPSKKIGSVIGKGGVIIKALREETQAKITIDDSVPGSEERVVIIYSPSSKKPVKQNDTMDLKCAAQDALFKLHDRILEEDTNNNEKVVVTVRLLVPNNTVGCLLGKRGDVIQRLRKETCANIRILPSDQLPVCGLKTDELVQISGKPDIVKRALYEISTLLHQNPRKDNPPSMTNLPLPTNPVVARWQRGDYDSRRIRSFEFDDDDRPVVPHGGGDTYTPAEFSMKILCPTDKIGGVIGKGGSNVRQIQQETGTSIHVDDVAGGSDERVICVSAIEALWNRRSRTIDAILALQDKTSEHDEMKGIVTTRLLMSSSKVGCILGKGGQVINEMRRRTKADIRVYSKEEKPKCASKDEDLVQVSGLYDTVKDAVAEIASRYRERCLGDAKPETQPSIHSGRLPFYESFKGSGREYEPLSYPASIRDHEPYVPPRRRDYEPYSHQGPPMDYEPRGYRAHFRDYESNRYAGYEPRGYPSPLRDYEPEGYRVPPIASRFLGDVDLEMSSSGRGYGIGNDIEISRTRPYGEASESSVADIRDSSHDPYQTYNGPKRPSYTFYEPHTNINPTSPTPYNHYYLNNQSQNSYQY